MPRPSLRFVVPVWFASADTAAFDTAIETTAGTLETVRAVAENETL